DPEEREALLEQGDPFFLPPYVGGKGWVGVRLDRPDTDWDEVAELIATSYCLIAPKRLAKHVTAPPSVGG
ncbi:MAG TPA: MmcQ/YjbR family DNA-binding protein, partial [Solirubrobacterales bacterium]